MGINSMYKNVRYQAKYMHGACKVILHMRHYYNITSLQSNYIGIHPLYKGDHIPRSLSYNKYQGYQFVENRSSISYSKHKLRRIIWSRRLL